MRTRSTALGGPILTRPYFVLLTLGVIGLVLITWRMIAGLGATTALNDGYPWGIWIAFDVVTGTALACGGYVIGLLVYLLNRGKYHPLVRPAVLTSALGYTIAAIAVGIDVGRPWMLWKVPVYFWDWNANSALLEVALCIMAYVVVLWLEMLPALVERWRLSKRDGLRDFAARITPILDKTLFAILALGVLLPTLHQSSLGSLMMLAGPKLDPLWQTAMLPLFFLVTVIGIGYAAVVLEATFSASVFRRRLETRMLGELQKFAVWVGVLFVVARFIDIAVRGQLALTLRGDLLGVMFWLETLLFLLPAVLLAARKGRLNPGWLVREALLIAAGATLYRFNTYLVAFNPGPEWSYFPSLQEIFITIGLVSLEIAAYIFLVKRFPIFAGEAARVETAVPKPKSIAIGDEVAPSTP